MPSTLQDIFGDLYLSSVVKGKESFLFPGSALYQVVVEIQNHITQWANNNLVGIYYSGSYAKTTSVIGSTDIDLFISLSPETIETLEEIFNSLFNWFDLRRFPVRKQNVSIGLTYKGFSIDLIPAKKRLGNTYDHSIYRNKQSTWTLTNINKHIDLIKNSNRLNEIRAIKIWRNVNQLDFPSFYLELAVLDGLSGYGYFQFAHNVERVLTYLSEEFMSRRLVDPANSSNVISDDLTEDEKFYISWSASNSLLRRNSFGTLDWGKIIW